MHPISCIMCKAFNYLSSLPLGVCFSIKHYACQLLPHESIGLKNSVFAPA
jgi:hypothetical protein